MSLEGITNNTLAIAAISVHDNSYVLGQKMLGQARLPWSILVVFVGVLLFQFSKLELGKRLE